VENQGKIGEENWEVPPNKKGIINQLRPKIPKLNQKEGSLNTLNKV